MKHVVVPLSALIVYILFEMLVYLEILPNLSSMFTSTNFENSLIFMFIIILLESIIYIGFYLPGQLIAVILVTQNSQGIQGILLLTFVSFFAVTLSSLINYYLGSIISKRENKSKNSSLDIKTLLLSMIHINTLAMFMFEQGIERKNITIAFLSGFLNIPYYLILISLTYFFKDEILLVAQNPYILYVLLILWLIYGVYRDIKEKKISL